MTGMGAVADYYIALTNAALEDSGVPAKLELAALRPVSLESLPATDPDSPRCLVLGAMQNGDAPFENIYEDMSNVDAGLAHALIRSGSDKWFGACAGRAYLGGEFQTARFGIMRTFDSLEYPLPRPPSYTFAHEVGHNLGALHNREQYAPNFSDYVFSYAYGYTVDCAQKTIMSYYECDPWETNP